MENGIADDCVTVVITSAGRKEYLQKTIESLKKYLLYEEDKLFWHIIDDYPNGHETRDYINSLKWDCKIFNEHNLGSGYSLNTIYSTVKTKWIFHCQDDWEFLKPINLKELINTMEGDPRIGQVLLQRKQRYMHAARVISDDLVEYPLSFSFNPHLTKTELFKNYGPFALKFTESDWSKKMWTGEYKTRLQGHFDDVPYVTHLGKTKKVNIL